MMRTYKYIVDKFSDNQAILDSIVVSLFVKTNNIKVLKNLLINSLILQKDSIYYSIINGYNEKLDFEDIIKIFELAIPKNNVVVNGAVYTPNFIKDYIFKATFEKGLKSIKKPLNEWVCADISCGCSAFLYTLSKKIKSLTNLSYNEIFQNVYGFDICANSINRAKILLSLLAISENEDRETYDFKLFTGNSLSNLIQEQLQLDMKDGFDIIVGNPPYVRSKNIDTETKLLLKNWTVSSGNTDLYIPFFEIGMSSLNTNGILGYITVNSFFKSVNARLLRKYFQFNTFDFSIIDFGQELIFEKKLAYTCITIIGKTHKEHISYAKLNSSTIKANDIQNISFDKINYNSLNYHKGWLLNEDNIVRNISKIEKVGAPLGELYNIKNGLATLANSVYIFKPTSEDNSFYYHKWNNEVYKIEKDLCKDIIKPNIIKSENDIDSKMEKIIFPYIDNKLISENELVAKYPFAYKYLNDNRNILDNRDKGNGNYAEWFAFGRTQALHNKGKKLLIPYMSDKPYAVYTDNENMLIYCGYAIYGNSTEEMLILKKVLESSIFDYYMRHTSKPYSTGYFSYAKNYIKHFGIYDFSEEEKFELSQLKSKYDIDTYLCRIYNIDYKSL